MRRITLPLIALLAATLACNLPLSGGETPTETPTETPQTAAEQSGDDAQPGGSPGTTQPAPQPTQAQAPTDQPAVTATVDDCPYDASYVTDVSVPDGTAFEPGEAFNKTWRLVNDGCRAWPEGMELIFIRGERMGGPASVAVRATVVSGTVDVTVPLVAPDEPGAHRGYWQLRAPDGTQFGPEIYADMRTREQGSSTVQGTASYPSEGIPPLRIFAQEVGGSDYYFVDTDLNQSTWEMDLPPATYIFFGYRLDGQGPGAGYTEYVRCGSSVNCTDHSLIEVVVGANELIVGIEIGDWYVPPELNEVPPAPEMP